MRLSSRIDWLWHQRHPDKLYDVKHWLLERGTAGTRKQKATLSMWESCQTQPLPFVAIQGKLPPINALNCPHLWKFQNGLWEHNVLH